MSQFLKQTLASLIGTIVGLLLLTTLGVSGLVILLIALAAQDTSSTVKDKSVLVFDLSTPITDTDANSSLAQAISGKEATRMTIRQVLQALDTATKDDRIVAIFLDGRKSGAQNGYATLAEVREALQRFRAAGKKIIAYDVEWTKKDYYLGSVADQVIINPMGIMEFNGLGVQPIFWAGALDKYGIGVQVVRVGSYKSAVEPFTRKDLSPQNRQQLQALLGDIWGNILTTVGDSRQLSTSKLQAIADNKGFLNPKAAKNAGLVDRVAYLDQVIADLKKLTNNQAKEEQSFRQISLENYLDVPAKNNLKSSSNHKIAILYAEGEIVDGKGSTDDIGGDSFTRELRKIRQDNDIKAVVLRINSPGGSATASEIILREVQLLKKQKPVIVSMGNVAASGGYWISTGGNYIFAEPTTITGSIGVFGLLFNVGKIANNNGITWGTVKTAKFADINGNNRPKTEQELGIYQQSVNQIYTLFIDKISQSRNLSKEKVAQIAQGRVWSGKDALKIGLIDKIGGLEQAVQYASEQANLGKDWEVEEYPVKRTWEEELVQKLFNAKVKETTQNLDPLTVEFIKFKEELAVLKNLNDPQGIYVRLPFNLQF